jgi:FixJ family two-component response regulator
VLDFVLACLVETNDPMPGSVFVVDDDSSVRKSLTLVLGLSGYGTRAFASAEEFLAICRPGISGCVIADLRMPGMSGLELQKTLADRRIGIPIIFMTAYGDVATTRAALKGGAVDFLEKPVDEEMLLQLVAEALTKHSESEEAAAQRKAASKRLESLTARERQVLDRIVTGRHNREIAAELKISSRTVEVYKARVMAKLGVTRIPELLKMVGVIGPAAAVDLSALPEKFQA